MQLGPDLNTTRLGSAQFLANGEPLILFGYTGGLWASLAGPAFGNFTSASVGIAELFDDPTSLPPATNVVGPGITLPLERTSQQFTVQIIQAGSGGFSVQTEGSLDGNIWTPIDSPITAPGVIALPKLGGVTPAYSWVRLNVMSISVNSLLTGFVVGL